MTTYFIKIRNGKNAGAYWRYPGYGTTPCKEHAHQYTCKDMESFNDTQCHLRNRDLVLVPVTPKPVYIIKICNGPYAEHYWMKTKVLTTLTRKPDKAECYTMEELLGMKFFETWGPSLASGRLKLINIYQ